MKKFLQAAILLISAITLGGCSNKNTINWEDGIIKQGNTVYLVDEFSGSGAIVEDVDYRIDFYICPEGPNGCFHNDLGIIESDMESFKGGSKYYAAYLDTNVVMYIPNGKTWIEGKLVTTEVGKMSLSECVDKLYAAGQNLTLSETVEKVLFQNSVILNVSTYQFKMRSNEVIIPGLLRLKLDDGSVQFTEQVSINDKALSKGTSKLYDYYKYENVVIQVVVGTDISGLVSFK